MSPEKRFAESIGLLTDIAGMLGGLLIAALIAWAIFRNYSTHG